MLTKLQKIYSAVVFSYIRALMPPTVINSFDCARLSLGAVQVAFDPLVALPPILVDGLSLEDAVAVLEAHCQLLSDTLNNLIQVRYLSVWNLGDVVHAWDVAPKLRERLDEMDRKFSRPDVFIYEFQMSANDKSRMVSTMLAYHYSGVKTIRIAPAVKNTLCVARRVTRSVFEQRCPQTAFKKIKNTATGKMTSIADLIFASRSTIDLNIQTFLAIVNDTYKANKLHTSACLEWWASIFRVDLSNVPKGCLDDAADGFMQIQGAFRQRLI